MKRRAWLGATLSFCSASVLAQVGRRGRERPEGGEGKKKPGAEPLHVDSLEVTLEEFREDLKLAPAQQPAWEAYANSLRALASDQARHARRQAAEDPPPSLLQRIDRLVEAAGNRYTALEDIAGRARALYGVLAPEQKAVCEPRLANIVLQVAGGNGGGSIERARRPGG